MTGTTVMFKNFRRRFLQIGAALTASLSFLAGGQAIGWTSPMLPLLLSDNSHIPMTADQSSWVVAMLSVGCIMGSLLLPLLTKLLGRKSILILIAIPNIIAWIIIMFASTVEALYVARFLFGMAIIITFAAAPMYLTEISEVAVRGMLSSIPQLVYNIGMILEFCLVPHVSYTLVAGISVLFPILFAVLMILMPESPYFLMLKGKEKQAEQALLQLRGQNVEQELVAIKSSVTENSKLAKISVKDLWMIRGNRRGLVILLGLGLLQVFCGQLAVFSYATQIFYNASSSLDPNTSVIILGCIQAVASLIMSSLVDRIGRRPLLISSTSGLAVSCFILGVYFHLQDNTHYDLSSLGWLPMVALILYTSSFSLALGVLPFTIMGEIFPTNVKGLAASFLFILHSVSSTLLTKLFQIMTDNNGADSPFWLFFAWCAVGTVFIAWYLPETMNKPFSEIYQELNQDVYPRKVRKEQILQLEAQTRDIPKRIRKETINSTTTSSIKQNVQEE